MATEITTVTPEIAEYLSHHFNAEDEFLRELRARALECDIPAINISASQGAFLQVLLRTMNARTVIEVGSLAGYSAIMMARALPPDGVVHCLELNEDYCDFIRRMAVGAGMAEKIVVHAGPALETLQADVLPGSVDFVFIDADKPNYAAYYDAAFARVRAGGVICADNTLAWGEIARPDTEFEPHNVRALQAYNAKVSTDARVQSSLVPLGDGMTLSVKL
ncbi:MAG: O-methyltransferase [Candidatus Kapaibacterium sp.]